MKEIVLKIIEESGELFCDVYSENGKFCSQHESIQAAGLEGLELAKIYGIDHLTIQVPE